MICINNKLKLGLLTFLLLLNLGWTNPVDFKVRLEQAKIYYQQSGLTEYFSQRSLLWTETDKRRIDLLKRLPPVAATALEKLQVELIELLQANPADPVVLILAGDYHYYYHQKETALWYYRQALKVAPNAPLAKLALADFYLDEWQPEQVQLLLTDLPGPEFSLRMGAAYLQSGEYPLAMGYLRLADPLPVKWQVTRRKDLFKTYLALGETAKANQVIKGNDWQGVVSGPIFQELLGWEALMAGNPKQVLQNWREGQSSYPDYQLWDSLIIWQQFKQTHLHGQNEVDYTKNLGDSFRNSAFKILQAQSFEKEQDQNMAYNEYLAGIKFDHRSLVGFLGVSTIELRNQDYLAALDLCNQGLAVNANFGPLLMTRAEINRKLGRISKANNDESAHNQSILTAQVPSKIRAELIQDSAGKAGLLLIRGETKSLTGLWVSLNYSDWEWYPWWGAPITLPTKMKSVWVVPCGPGISGEAFYLESNGLQNGVELADSPQLQNGEVVVRLTSPAKLIIENTDHDPSVFVSGQLTKEHHISFTVFNTSNPNGWFWLQDQNGGWKRIAFHFTLPKVIPAQPVIQNKLSYDNMVLNQETSLSDTTPPQLTALEHIFLSPVLVQISLIVTETVAVKFKIFNKQGRWQEIPVVQDSDSRFTGFIPLESTVFCQVVLQDQAGNIAVFNDHDLNESLNGALRYHFYINDGKTPTNSRFVVIKTNTVESGFTWSVSNDLLVWSPWQQGVSSLKWRLNPENGEQLVFVKYKTINSLTVSFQVLTICLDPMIPEVQETIPGTGNGK